MPNLFWSFLTFLIDLPSLSNVEHLLFFIPVTFAMFAPSLFCLGTIGIEPKAGVQPHTFFPWAQ